MIDLTKRQAEILRWITWQIKGPGAPTYREIASEFGIGVNAAQCHVAALVRKGWLVIPRPGVARGLRLT